MNEKFEKKLVSKNITLREFDVNDIETKVNWINDSINNQFLHYDLPLTIEGTTKWFNNKDKKRRIDYIIEYNGIPVGLIGLLQIDQFNQKAEYYITIGNHDFKKKGIASEASRILIRYAFEKLGLRKIYLNVDEENVIARSLYKKLGFKCEGIFIDDMFFKGKWINRRRYAIINKEKIEE